MTASRTTLLACVWIAVVAASAYGTSWTWTTLDYPGANSTIFNAIDGNTILGQSSTGSYLYSFLYNGTTWTTLPSYPSAPTASRFGISGSKIVGRYYDTKADHGFLDDGGTWTSLDFPGDVTATDPLGISGNNIVGWYEYSTPGSNGFPQYHRCGFLYNGTTWTALNHPNASATMAEGVDNNNNRGLL